MTDVFQNLDATDAATMKMLADRLEFRGSYPPFVAMRERYFDALPLDAVRSALDMGCGTGVVTRALAARLPEGARIAGSDVSAALAGLSARIAFEVADGHGTDGAAAGHDLVLLHTLVSHVTDPAAVLSEAARLTAPGGWIAVFDGDYASIALGAGDPAMNERALAAFRQALVTNPNVMRHMPALAAAAGLRLETYLPEVLAEAGRAAYFLGLVTSLVEPMIASGDLDRAAAERWAAGQIEASEGGTFFASCNFGTFILRKPEA